MHFCTSSLDAGMVVVVCTGFVQNHVAVVLGNALARYCAVRSLGNRNNSAPGDLGDIAVPTQMPKTVKCLKLSNVIICAKSECLKVSTF